MRSETKIVKDVDYSLFCGEDLKKYVKEKKEFKQEGTERIEKGYKLLGDPLPWSKTQDMFRFRPGEVTIWSGWNGHGKSYLTGQVALWIARYRKVFIASFEMHPVDTLLRMAEQAAGTSPITTSYWEQFSEWKSDKMYVYDKRDVFSHDDVIGLITHNAKELGINHFFIDSLMKLGISDDDYNGQRALVDAICWAAASNNVHVHLVAHLKKDQNEEVKPNKFHIKGSGGIADLAHNVFTLWRNKRKEIRIQNGDEDEDLDNQPDVVLTLEKQRNGPTWEGAINLWTHKKSMQFMGKPSRTPMLFELN